MTKGLCLSDCESKSIQLTIIEFDDEILSKIIVKSATRLQGDERIEDNRKMRLIIGLVFVAIAIFTMALVAQNKDCYPYDDTYC